MTIYIQYMYLLFTQIAHIHSHLCKLIAQAVPCFCLVFTTRGEGETGKKSVSITMQVEHEMICSGGGGGGADSTGKSPAFELEECAGLI